MSKQRDHGLDSLLELDGLVLFVDEAGNYSVKFVVKVTEVTTQRPHGLSYSLTLHGKNGERIVGFDNAHTVSEGSGPGKRQKAAYDHKHVGGRVRAYEYADAASLLEDFWVAVDAALKKEGVLK
jgi:uncharacterized protein DUF6516